MRRMFWLPFCVRSTRIQFGFFLCLVFGSREKASALNVSTDAVSDEFVRPFVIPFHPCNDVVEVKTMKCASTTFEKILSQSRARCKKNQTACCKYAHGEKPLPFIEHKKNVTTTFTKDFLRVALAREPMARVISHFYQCRPSKFWRGGNNRQCRQLAEQGPEEFFGSKHRFVNNLQSVFYGWNGKKENKAEAKRLADQFDIIIIQDHLAESLAMLHFYGVLEVSDMFFYSQYVHKTEHVYMSERALELASSKNGMDFLLFEEVMRRHNATLVLFHGLELAAQRWDQQLKIARAACENPSRARGEFGSQHERPEMDLAGWQPRTPRGAGRERCLAEACRAWLPCVQNDLGYGLPGVGLTTDLRAQPHYFRSGLNRPAS